MCNPTPAPVAGGHTFTALSAGFAYTCGLATDGTWYCWGRNNYGQLGNGTTGPELCGGAYPCSTVPVAVSVETGLAIVSPGYHHGCGSVSGGAVYCWGANPFGQLGDGSLVDNTAAVAVTGGLSFASVSAYLEHTCGLATSGVAYCWGRNTWGELGDGHPTGGSGTDGVRQPVRVAGQAAAVAAQFLGVSPLTSGRALPAPPRRPARP